MNPVQIDQILPQVSFNTNEKTLPGQETSDYSFEDALAKAQYEEVSQTDEAQSPSYEEKKVSVKKSDKEEETPSTSSDELKSLETVNASVPASFTVQEEIPEITFTMNENLEINIEEINPDASLNEDMRLNSSELLLTEKNLAWLDDDEQTYLADEVADDIDINDLLTNAKEFIPGESEKEEELLSSQNKSVTEPLSFLSELENASQSEEVAQIQDKGEALIQSLSEKSDGKSRNKTDVKDNKVRFKITDERTQTQNTVSPKAVTKVQEKAAASEAVFDKNGNPSQQLSADMALTSQQNITSSSAQAAGANGSTFEGMLSNAIQQNIPDFVKAGSIVLKDGNAGQINLVLHPESLGSVKISLSLNDKVISGQINVSSQAAFDAFKDNIEALKQAFNQSGFEASDFNLNFTGQQNFAQSNGGDGQGDNSSFMAQSAYGELVAASDDSTSTSQGMYENNNYSVNIVA